MTVALQEVPPNAVSNILPAFGFFVAWATLYLLLCLLDPRRPYEWHVRSVTTVHAVLVCSMTGWSSFILGPCAIIDFERLGGPMTRMEYVTCNVCLGYFLFDFAWCLFFQSEGLIMVLHHSLSIVGNAAIIYWAVSGTEMMVTIFGSELTNPLLQLRWFLRVKNYNKTLFAQLNDLLFVVLFCCLRIGVGSVLLIMVLRHSRPYFLVKLGGALHYAVGWAFSLQIIRYAIRKYRKMQHAQQHINNKHLREAVGEGSEDAARLPPNPAEGDTANGVVHRINTVK